MTIRRRDLLFGSAALAACGRSELASPLIVPARAAPRPLPPYRKNAAYHQQPVAPVHLSGSLLLRSGASGAVARAAMQNPMGQAMEILEIKFYLSGGAQGVLSTPAVWGGSIWCELSVGDQRLTNGSVPVWNFGRAENLAGEQAFDSSDSSTYLAYSWRLPRPYYLAAGEVLEPKFVHTGYVPESVNVRIGLSGRTVSRQPRTICVPYAAKYASKAFNPIQNADVDQSTELDLVNNTPQALHLQRFTGRTLYLDTLGGGSEQQPNSFGSQSAQVRIVDSYGRPIVRSYTPFRSVFGALTRSWEMDNGALLDPGSYYRIQVKKAANANEGNGTGQLFIGMVGWREVSAS